MNNLHKISSNLTDEQIASIWAHTRILKSRKKVKIKDGTIYFYINNRVSHTCRKVSYTDPNLHIKFWRKEGSPRDFLSEIKILT